MTLLIEINDFVNQMLVFIIDWKMVTFVMTLSS